MAASLDEVAQLGPDELDEEIRQLLRPGEAFSVSPQERSWYAEITSGETPLWDSVGFDLRILLLDAYGWLWARNQTGPSNPLWTRRRELTREMVARKAASLPDPEDLDPNEIQAVYEGTHTHGKKD